MYLERPKKETKKGKLTVDYKVIEGKKLADKKGTEIPIGRVKQHPKKQNKKVNDELEKKSNIEVNMPKIKKIIS